MRPLLALFLLTADYRAEITQWRFEHEAALKADWGWLTVTGLFWLKPGANTIGSEPSSDVLLPSGSASRFGTVTPGQDAVKFLPAVSSSVTFEGKPVRAGLILRPGNTLSSGGIQLLLIRRGGKLALRLKDSKSKLRREFAGLKWFPIDERWRITGHWVPAPQGTKLTFDTVLGGTETMNSPGFVVFAHGGASYKLLAAEYDERLFFVFRDRTSGKETYPACRFLYSRVESNQTVTLDFNKAENPPCAFTPHATCPLPPPQNRLPFSIPAGEQNYTGSH